MNQVPFLYQRRHGFQLPWNWYQIYCIASFLGMQLGLWCLGLPFLYRREHRFALGVCSGVLSGIVILAFILTGNADTTDPGVSYDEKSDSHYYCNFCKAWVHSRSKHCSSCNRCSAGFDHHCTLVNNCIGGGNYIAFFGLLTATNLLVGLQEAVVIRILTLIVEDRGYIERAVKDLYGVQLPYWGFLILELAYLVWVMLSQYPLLQLWLFHIALCYRGMSTLDYFHQYRYAKSQITDETAPLESGTLSSQAISTSIGRPDRPWSCISNHAQHISSSGQCSQLIGFCFLKDSPVIPSQENAQSKKRKAAYNPMTVLALPQMQEQDRNYGKQDTAIKQVS